MAKRSIYTILKGFGNWKPVEKENELKEIKEFIKNNNYDKGKLFEWNKKGQLKFKDNFESIIHKEGEKDGRKIPVTKN